MARDYYWEGVLRGEVRWAKEKRDLGIGGSCFDGEPRQTACTELAGDDTVIPKEAWAVHGEEKLEELDMGFPLHYPHDSNYHHVDLENIEDDNREYDDTEDEREANRDPEWDPNNVAQAGVALILTLNLARTREMCNVVGAYMGRLECRMDGVIQYCLDNRRNEEIVKASLEFAERMRRYFPEISKKAKNRLIADAQMEQQLQRRTNGPAYRLGQTIFEGHWRILLRT